MKKRLRLLRPSARHKTQYLKGLREFAIEEGKSQRKINKLVEGFEDYVRILRNYEKGSNLPKGHVTSSTYWLFDGPQYIGETTIRHRLTPGLQKEGGHIGYGIRPSMRRRGYGKAILRLALLKGKTLEMKRFLITCDDNNIASRKVIEANGGKFIGRVHNRGKSVRRYWIGEK